MIEFKKNEIYTRRVLHDKFGGNRQNGISPCSKFPIIFIFSGESGKKYGYEDIWDNDGVFRYSGEGKVGDMSFKGGNKSILNHKLDGKSIFLFEKTKISGKWKYIDELSLVSFEYHPSFDENGDKRTGIRFYLKSSSEKEKHLKKVGTNNDEFENSEPNITERRGLITSRVGQGIYRIKIIEKWNKKCPVTKCNILSILISSHIKSWSESNNKERLDVENGILLSPNVDSLFDKHLITFTNGGELLVSKFISKNELNQLGIDENIIIPVSEGMKKYLERHRTIFHDLNG